MAQAGRKPTPPGLKVLKGNPGNRPIPEGEIEMRTDPLLSPEPLTARQQYYWSRYIDAAWWLTESDTAKAHMWVCMQTQFAEDPGAVNSAIISNLRSLGSELGFDPAAKARMASARPGKDEDDEFFG